MIEALFKKFLESNNSISTDTRNITPGSLFFALKGDNFDGNLFAEEAIKKGASYAVIDNPKFQTPNTILVDNTLKALQQLANYYRTQQGFKVLALTGSNGKTTTKELIYQVLKTKFRCQATTGNLNNHIGVPLTILSAKPGVELLIVEMGANHVGEIKELCAIADPDLGLITNIGKAHLEGFGGYQGVIKAKSELYNYLINKNGAIFCNRKDELLKSLLNNYSEAIYYGDEASKYFVVQTSFDQGVKVQLSIEGELHSVASKLFGNYNVFNILTALRIGRYFKIETKTIVDALSSYTPTNNRSQIQQTKNNNTLIIDSYNANPSSMKAAFDSFKEINAENKVAILGGMKELGSESHVEHELLLQIATESGADNILLVGSEFAKCNLQKNMESYASTEMLILRLKDLPFTNALILIKGSRANKLEIIVEHL